TVALVEQPASQLGTIEIALLVAGRFDEVASRNSNVMCSETSRIATAMDGRPCSDASRVASRPLSGFALDSPCARPVSTATFAMRSCAALEAGPLRNEVTQNEASGSRTKETSHGACCDRFGHEGIPTVCAGRKRDNPRGETMADEGARQVPGE